MQTMMVQTKIDFKRAYWRNPRFVIFSLLMPIAFYLLFTKVMKQGVMNAAFNRQYMVSMATYSLVLSNTFTLSTLLYNDARDGLVSLIDLSPTSYRTYYGAKLLNLGLINALTIGVIFIVAGISNQIHLAWSSWLLTAGWLWFASIPLCLIGISISFLKDENQIQLVSNLLAFPLAILGGLWWPTEIMPKTARVIGKHLPVYPINHIGQALIAHQPAHLGEYGITLLWAGLLLAIVVYLNHHKRGAMHA